MAVYSPAVLYLLMSRNMIPGKKPITNRRQDKNAPEPVFNRTIFITSIKKILVLASTYSCRFFIGFYFPSWPNVFYTVPAL